MRALVERVMGGLCALVRHAGGCGLLNDRVLAFYRPVTQSFLVDVPSPTARLWRWATRDDRATVPDER